MRITLFTSNQPRHSAFVSKLAQICDELYVVVESTTIFPGKIPSFFSSSSIMQEYFKEVLLSEKKFFGPAGFIPPSVNLLNLSYGDLKYLSTEDLGKAASSDIFLVFGCGFISGEVGDFLIKRSALNIHMGASPYYRGASCNMWAMYNKKPEFIIGTVHNLSNEIDSGSIVFQVLPPVDMYEPFDLGMAAVKATLAEILKRVKNQSIYQSDVIDQPVNLTKKLCKKSQFTDTVAKALLKNRMTPKEIKNILANRKLNDFFNPVISSLDLENFKG